MSLKFCERCGGTGSLPDMSCCERCGGGGLVNERGTAMNRVVMFVCAFAAGMPIEAFLESYDPDGNGGRGDVKLTRRFEHAKIFQDSTDAIECWRRVSTLHPVRRDGRPNRPLTAYTVTFINESDAPAYLAEVLAREAREAEQTH